MARYTDQDSKAGTARAGSGTLFGVPMADLGWFASLIMGIATGFAAFFAATFLGIVTILVLNTSGKHADYTLAYRRIGLPVGLLVGLAALAYLGTMWARRKLRRA